MAVRVLLARRHSDARAWQRKNRTERPDFVVMTGDVDHRMRLAGLSLTPGAVAETEYASTGAHYDEIIRLVRDCTAKSKWGAEASIRREAKADLRTSKRLSLKLISDVVASLEMNQASDRERVRVLICRMDAMEHRRDEAAVAAVTAASSSPPAPAAPLVFPRTEVNRLRYVLNAIADMAEERGQDTDPAELRKTVAIMGLSARAAALGPPTGTE